MFRAVSRAYKNLFYYYLGRGKKPRRSYDYFFGFVPLFAYFCAWLMLFKFIWGNLAKLGLVVHLDLLDRQLPVISFCMTIFAIKAIFFGLNHKEIVDDFERLEKSEFDKRIVGCRRFIRISLVLYFVLVIIALTSSKLYFG